jgi:hypothetical protein
MKTHPKARLGLAGRHALVAMIGGGQSMRAAARAFNGDVTRRCAGARVHTQTTQGRDGDLRTARPARAGPIERRRRETSAAMQP